MALIFSISNANIPATFAADSSATISSTWSDDAPPQPTTDFSQTLQDQTDKIKPHHASRSSKHHNATPSSKTATSQDDAQPPTTATTTADKTQSHKNDKADANNNAATADGSQLDPNHAQSLVAYVDQAQQIQPAPEKTPTANSTPAVPAPENSAAALVPGSPALPHANTPAKGTESSCDAKSANNAASASDDPLASDPDTNNQCPDDNATQRAFPSLKANAAKDMTQQHSAPTAATAESTGDASPNSHTSNAPPVTPGIPAGNTIQLPLPATPIIDPKTTASTTPAPPTPPIGEISVSATPAQTNSATVAAAAQQSPAPAHENVLDQVIMGLHGKLDPQNGKAEIRLDPPNLGSLRVSINLNKGALTAQFSTSTDVVRDLLSSHMDKLRSVLENQGITVDHLAVQTQPEPSQSQAQDQQNTGSSNHDGRSAGGYEQNRRDTQHDPNDLSFARTFEQAREETPIDVLA